MGISPIPHFTGKTAAPRPTSSAKIIPLAAVLGICFALLAPPAAIAESIWERCTACAACCPDGFAICMTNNADGHHPVCPKLCTKPPGKACPSNVNGGTNLDKMSIWHVRIDRGGQSESISSTHFSSSGDPDLAQVLYMSHQEAQDLAALLTRVYGADFEAVQR